MTTFPNHNGNAHFTKKNTLLSSIVFQGAPSLLSLPAIFTDKRASASTPPRWDLLEKLVDGLCSPTRDSTAVPLRVERPLIELQLQVGDAMVGAMTARSVDEPLQS